MKYEGESFMSEHAELAENGSRKTQRKRGEIQNRIYAKEKTMQKNCANQNTSGVRLTGNAKKGFKEKKAYSRRFNMSQQQQQQKGQDKSTTCHTVPLQLHSTTTNTL